MRIAKIVWLILAGSAIGLSIIGLPLYYTQLSHPCKFHVATCSEQLIPTAAEFALLKTQGWSPEQYALVYLGFRTIQSLITIAIGLVIFSRKSNDRGTLIISLALILFSTGDGRLAVGAAYPALTVPIQLLDYLATVSLGLMLITFPDGRVVPRVMWLVIAYWCAFFFADYLNLFEKNGEIAFVLSATAWIGLLLTSVAAQVYRYFRVSTRNQRQQTKWVVFGWTVMLVLFMVFAVSRISDSTLSNGVSIERVWFLFLVNLITLILPISIGIAILRRNCGISMSSFAAR